MRFSLFWGGFFCIFLIFVLFFCVFFFWRLGCAFPPRIPLAWRNCGQCSVELWRLLFITPKEPPEGFSGKFSQKIRDNPPNAISRHFHSLLQIHVPYKIPCGPLPAFIASIVKYGHHAKFHFCTSKILAKFDDSRRKIAIRTPKKFML